MIAALVELFAAGLRRKLLSLTAIAALLLLALAALLTAAGFGLALLFVWLQGLYGTMPALAIVGGGCAALAVLLVLATMLRGGRRAGPAYAARPTGQKTVDEAIAAIQQGSRESMLAALTLAVIAGVSLGRKL